MPPAFIYGVEQDLGSGSGRTQQNLVDLAEYSRMLQKMASCRRLQQLAVLWSVFLITKSVETGGRV